MILCCEHYDEAHASVPLLSEIFSVMDDTQNESHLNGLLYKNITAVQSTGVDYADKHGVSQLLTHQHRSIK